MTEMIKPFIITCPFGMRTLPGVRNGKPHMHKGIDVRAPIGTKIVTPANGKILRHGRGKEFGENFVVLLLTDYDVTVKAIHCDIAGGVTDGQQITEGNAFAVSDGSGTNAAHLHFETWNGKTGQAPNVPFDPIEFLEKNNLPYRHK